MFKSAVLLAVLLGLCTCAPLLNDGALPLEAALRIPETEERVNTPIVLENMPAMAKLVEDLPELKEEAKIERDLKTLQSLQARETIIDKAVIVSISIFSIFWFLKFNKIKIESQEDEIKREQLKIDTNEVKILDELREAEKIELNQILLSENATRVVEEIRNKLISDEERIVNDSALNKTVKEELESGLLSKGERVELVTEHLDEAERKEIVSDELRLRKMNETLVESGEEIKQLEMDVLEREKADRKMKEALKAKEEEFLVLVKGEEKLKQEIKEVGEKLLKEKEEVESEESKEEKDVEEKEEKETKERDLEKDSSEEEKKVSKEFFMILFRPIF